MCVCVGACVQWVAMVEVTDTQPKHTCSPSMIVSIYFTALPQKSMSPEPFKVLTDNLQPTS